ncbi:SDR family oxidoreductase [Steroidobacter sp.]|uniref:SDR family oxidoreductase n=1 Tax=Steroidobacter sp. TaxID=1978227 RepID=UPI0039F5D967
MSGTLQGKSCLITAAAQGIGRETAIRFAAEGATVLATDIAEDLLQQLAQEYPLIRTQRLDVSDPQGITALVENNAGFDVVFNCAGYVHQGTILDCDEDSWRRSFTLNVDSMYRVCRAVIPHMINRGGGVIINMSSVASSVRGVASRFAYGATKAAVIGLTKSIAADFVGSGIRCNAICPGTVRTPSLQQRVRALPGEEEDNWRAFVSRQPMGRLGEPVEIAALALYLASDQSAFTTGALHVIDGGWTN